MVFGAVTRIITVIIGAVHALCARCARAVRALCRNAPKAAGVRPWALVPEDGTRIASAPGQGCVAEALLHLHSFLIIVLFVLSCMLFPTSFHAYPEMDEARIFFCLLLIIHSCLFAFVEHVLYYQVCLPGAAPLGRVGRVTVAPTSPTAGRTATRVNQMEQGPTEPHAGRSTFLLSFGGTGGGYY